ncbi:Uncharacterised protein [Burkholderia pseudomallei]|nr:Uncharacterised protein [Burkholderia pseudomallei]
MSAHVTQSRLQGMNAKIKERSRSTSRLFLYLIVYALWYGGVLRWLGWWPGLLAAAVPFILYHAGLALMYCCGFGKPGGPVRVSSVLADWEVWLITLVAMVVGAVPVTNACVGAVVIVARAAVQWPHRAHTASPS